MKYPILIISIIELSKENDEIQIDDTKCVAKNADIFTFDLFQ